jgi:hypothetical protein
MLFQQGLHKLSPRLQDFSPLLTLPSSPVQEAILFEKFEIISAMTEEGGRWL